MAKKVDASEDRDLRLHRKYTYVLCIILLLIQFGGIVKPLEYSILGTKLVFVHPEVVWLAIWGLLAYSCFRYWQYFSQNKMRRENQMNYNKHIIRERWNEILLLAQKNWQGRITAGGGMTEPLTNVVGLDYLKDTFRYLETRKS